MCNYCNSGTAASYGCTRASVSYGCNGGSWVNQRLCRDGCGNVWIRRVQSCNCGCNGGSTGNDGNGGCNQGNHGFICFPVWGASSNGVRSGGCGGNSGYGYYGSSASVNGDGDSYYARQYGLLSMRSYPCSAGCGYGTVTTTTT